MLADLLCKFGRTVSLLPVLTQNYPKKLPETSFLCGNFRACFILEKCFSVEAWGLSGWQGGGGSLKAKTMRRRRENKRECGEEERVPNELLADEGRSS